jgi:hypothetical protein
VLSSIRRLNESNSSSDFTSPDSVVEAESPDYAAAAADGFIWTNEPVTQLETQMTQMVIAIDDDNDQSADTRQRVRKEIEFPAGRVGFSVAISAEGIKIIDVQQNCPQKIYEGDLLFAIDNWRCFNQSVQAVKEIFSQSAHTYHT